MSQIRIPKLSSYIDVAPNPNSVVVTKLSVYIELQPGEDGGDTPPRQVHVYSQKIRRA